MVVGEEHKDNLGDELNGGGRSADPADRARGRRKPPRSELGGRPNNQKAARSSSRRNMNLNLNCLNQTTIRDYDIQCLIGQGAFGVVQRATTKANGQKVAIKQYDRSKLLQDANRVVALNKESAILAKLSHEGIMGFVDSIDSGNKINIVVEYINGNNLYQYIRKLPESRIKDENEVKIIFKKTLESVQYMHEQRVIHRDLKLENILIDRKTQQTKLIDFGFATVVKSISETKLPYSCGTPIYMCPEMAMKKEHLGGPSDVWALGVILFILLTGKMPFHGGYEEDLFRKVISGKYQWPHVLTDQKGQLAEISQGAKNLVRRMLNPDQTRRPSAETLLQDTWLKSTAIPVT